MGVDSDLFFVLGVVIAALSLPSILGAISEGRAPRAAAILVMIGGGLILLAVYQRPGLYSLQSTPEAFVRVVARYLN